MLASSNPFVEAVIAIMASYGPPTPPRPDAVARGFNEEYRDLPPGNTKAGGQKRFDLPVAYFEDGQRYNPGEALKQFRKPKLLIYGDQDKFTDPQAIKDIYGSLDGPKVLREVHSEHDYRLHQETVQEVNDIINDFLGTLV